MVGLLVYEIFRYLLKFSRYFCLFFLFFCFFFAASNVYVGQSISALFKMANAFALVRQAQRNQKKRWKNARFALALAIFCERHSPCALHTYHTTSIIYIAIDDFLGVCPSFRKPLIGFLRYQAEIFCLDSYWPKDGFELFCSKIVANSFFKNIFSFSSYHF